MKKIILLGLLMVGGGLAGCSTAGPFVTGISSDGNGGLVVEKSMVEMNSFTGNISNKNPTTEKIYLYPQNKPKGQNAQPAE